MIELIPTEPPRLAITSPDGDLLIHVLTEDEIKELNWQTNCWLSASEAPTNIIQLTKEQR